jgi:hypothetical protein
MAYRDVLEQDLAWLANVVRSNRPLMAPAGTRALSSEIQTSPYRLSETGRILYPRSAYLGWPHQAPTTTSCDFVRTPYPVAADAPGTLQSHPRYVVSQTWR